MVGGRSVATSSRRGVLATVADAVRSQLWPIPVAGVVAAVVLGLVMVRIDAWADDRMPSYAQILLFGGDADAARALLDAMASSLITVTSLTFSLTVVTLQLASSQFSPRLLRTFAGDRFVQWTLALFLATFVFALTVLRSVRGQDAVVSSFVPRLSVTVAFVLTIASVLALVLFLAHLAREIRVETMLKAVHADTEETIRRELSESGDSQRQRPDPPADARPVLADRSGFLITIDQQRLYAVADELDAIIWVDQPSGASIVEGTPMAFCWSPDRSLELDEKEAGRIQRALTLAVERSGATDISFGLRQITDVAVKALSPGINDPTTASHALGHSAAVLSLLADRDTGPVVLLDPDSGQVRVMLARPDFAELLDLAVAQPRHYGAAEPAVHARTLQLLREVAWSSAADDRRAAVRAELDRTVDVVDGQSFDEVTRRQLDQKVEQVRAALRGQWPPTRTPG